MDKVQEFIRAVNFQNFRKFFRSLTDPDKFKPRNSNIQD